MKTDVQLGAFESIDLEELDRVTLMSRMDTKYAFDIARLPEVIATLHPEYRVLEVNGVRGTLYRTLYYDTADRKHYFDHHNGRTFRSKVRFREYVGSNLFFLEVKRKTGRGGTDKKRIQVEGIAETMSAAQQAFVAEASNFDLPLVPTLWNEFFRTTFVHRERAERLTIDRDLSFSNASGRSTLPDLCVAELKEARTGHGSPFTALMRSIPVPPSNLSKYCIGTLLLEPAIKHNNFKPTLLRVRQFGNAV
jgi:hypothetical protein